MSPSVSTPTRAPGEPAPDLLDYRVVHRAMTRDLARLATVAEDLVRAPDPRRLRLVRWYLVGVTAEIVHHHRVEDDDLWPLLEAVAGDLTVLVGLTGDHQHLDPLLARVGELAAADTATAELAETLHELADLLARHVGDEERDVFPIITERVRVQDYAWLQQRFRGTLGLAVLTFVVPWVIGHATGAERAVLLADAPAPLRGILAVTEGRFRARAARLFATGLSAGDRRRVRRMRRVNRVHQALVRLSRGRWGHGWFGESVAVALTVTGRRSGRAHTVMLMALHDGDDVIVAASQGGVDREPHWWLNLQTDPHAELEFRGRRYPVRAEEIEGEARDTAWRRFVDALPRGQAEGYQAKVRRRIALVRLRPARKGEQDADGPPPMSGWTGR